ncbi:MSHA biogenesis protein MshN [Vibrio zhanjiangensis]|uniref:MSHA biogenesis protein MshN n=1 Tax=Vibrio zhanjiangensis TaxID=1046128 RepID=A0ABQ6EV95_9VIBR|nr:tetratricopeptide repeat protein [Vibrio zhanjiangensis]GLT17110.1 MSHA biogenesis protein MshN [Vibrio zhanjiangensis]
MSAINNALSELAKSRSHQQPESVVKAHVKPIKQRRVFPWVMGSFALSLAVGGWTLSVQSPLATQQSSTPKVKTPLPIETLSPTAKSSVSADTIYVAQSAGSVQKKQDSIALGKETKTPSSALQPSKIQPQKSVKYSNLNGSQKGEMVIQQVELSPSQLSEKAQHRANKALENNNIDQALDEYQQALRYEPNNIEVRKKLSALYYGKGDVRKAVEILNKGIQIDKESSVLRLALAKLLIKEKQNDAALTALVYVPQQASVDYISLRAALAQKANHDEIALNSYQSLVSLEPDSGRWWLGLGIQQERALDLSSAEEAYQQALTKLGLSSQSQQFIRDRLALIRHLEDHKSAD